jgi:hypothetical protein
VGSVADLRRALDPVALAEGAGIVPDPWQERVLRSDAPRVLLNCSRQAGKSTVSAVLAAHRAAYAPRSLVLLLSPSQRQSSELFQKARRVLPVRPEKESALRLELANGSRILSLPSTEASVRGFSAVDLLVVDEAARVPDDLYLAVRPMLAVSGGRLVALSTPWGKRGWFWEAWSGETWERFEVPATEIGRISGAFLAEEEGALGPRWFRQEYLCSFEETEDSVFASEAVETAITSEVTPLFGEGC